MVRSLIESELPEISHHIEVLRGICHAFASATDLEEATGSTVRWAQAAIGAGGAPGGDTGHPHPVRVFLPDEKGDLRLAAAGGEFVSETAPDWAQVRRRVFHSRASLVFDPPERPGCSVAVFPFMCRGEILGVLEVLATGPELSRSWETLEAVVSQAAMALANAGRRSPKLQEASKGEEQERFNFGLAVAAHELRTPLLGAKAAVEHLAGNKDSASLDSRVLWRVSRELDQLAQLVELVLRWSAGPGSIDLRTTDLVSVVREAIFSCGHEDAMRVRVSAPQRVPLRADPRHIRGAIANVIVNALVYSPAECDVEIEVGRRDGWAWVAVVDHGHGVQPDEVDSIFDPFTRGAAAGSDRGPGAGLGLFIARKVIEGHGGRISVESNGRGATFLVELPTGEAGA